MGTTITLPGRESSDESWPPNSFGDYEVVRTLGQGGMGVVFLVRRQHPEGEKHYALKTCRPDRQTDLIALRKFLDREKNALFRMEHGNVVRFIEAGKEKLEWNRWQTVTDTGKSRRQKEVVTVPYIVLNFVEGTDAERLLNSSPGPLDSAAACHIGCEVLKGLEHVHGHGLIHRDIKPSNILIKLNAEVLITDFGLVEVSGAEDVYGTPLYISPEQARGEKTTEQSDIYSLGATLYYLLSRKSIFPDIGIHNKRGLLAAHRDPSRAATPLNTVRQNVPRELSEIVTAMVDKTASKRPGTEDIERALSPFADRYRLRDLMHKQDVSFTTIAGDDVAFGDITKRTRLGRISQQIQTNRRSMLYLAGAGAAAAMAYMIVQRETYFQDLSEDEIVFGKKYDLLQRRPEPLGVDDGRRHTSVWTRDRVEINAVGTYLLALGKLPEGATGFTIEADILPQKWDGEFGFFYAGRHVADRPKVFEYCETRLVVPRRGLAYILSTRSEMDLKEDRYFEKNDILRHSVDSLSPGNTAETFRLDVKNSLPLAFHYPGRGADGAFQAMKIPLDPTTVPFNASGLFGLLVRGGTTIFENVKIRINKMENSHVKH